MAVAVVNWRRESQYGLDLVRALAQPSASQTIDLPPPFSFAPARLPPGLLVDFIGVEAAGPSEEQLVNAGEPGRSFGEEGRSFGGE